MATGFGSAPATMFTWKSWAVFFLLLPIILPVSWWQERQAMKHPHGY